jgi:hypothetical protein
MSEALPASAIEPLHRNASDVPIRAISGQEATGGCRARGTGAHPITTGPGRLTPDRGDA